MKKKLNLKIFNPVPPRILLIMYSLLYVSTTSGTQSGKICVDVWSDLCQIISSPQQPHASNLGLQLIHQSLEMLTHAYQSLKVTNKNTLYSILPAEYISPIQLFIRKLCFGLVSKWAEDVSMETSKYSQGTYYVCVCVCV